MTTENAASKPPPFAVKDCAVIAIATARRASTIGELLEGVVTIPPESLYYHFWTGLLQARFEEREFNNDFAGWVAHHLHERRLAEQLAVLDPTGFADLEALRGALTEIIQGAVDEDERISWLRADRPFDFLRSQIVIFDTGRRPTDPVELAAQLPALPAEAIFYHFIDARRREPRGVDDFSIWIAAFGETTAPLVRALAGIDYYFGSLPELRETLVEIFRHHLSMPESP